MSEVKPRIRARADVSPPVPMAHVDKTRLRRVAHLAGVVLPGPVGELIGRELTSWEEFSYRLGGGAFVGRLIADIEQRVEQDRAERHAS